MPDFKNTFLTSEALARFSYLYVDMHFNLESIKVKSYSPIACHFWQTPWVTPVGNFAEKYMKVEWFKYQIQPFGLSGADSEKRFSAAGCGSVFPHGADPSLLKTQENAFPSWKTYPEHCFIPEECKVKNRNYHQIFI